MKIETIEQTRGSRLRVCFDNGTVLKILPSAMAELGLYPGMEIPDGAMESIRDTCGAASAKERAVRIISAATVSKRELRYRLEQKGEKPEHAAAAVEWLEELNLLNDEKAAEQVVQNGIARGYGPARIRQMLYEKKIPKGLWEDALARVPDQSDAIESFLAKRFRAKSPDAAECRRAAQALLRRGHSWGDIRRAMERYEQATELASDWD